MEIEKRAVLKIGDRIRVVGGPYHGMKGWYGGQRVGRYLCVELEGLGQGRAAARVRHQGRTAALILSAA